MSERELDRTIGEGRALRVGAGPTNGRNRRAPLVAGRPREGPFTIRFADLSSSFILVRSRTTNRHPLSCPVLLITLKCAPHRTEQRDPDAKFPLIEHMRSLPVLEALGAQLRVFYRVLDRLVPQPEL